jgi:ParB/RepB/Spo0J family partition protein
MAKKKTIDLDQFFTPATPDDDLSFLIGATPEETARRATERGMPLLYLPVEAIAPDPQQLRRLPRPDELMGMAEGGDRAAATIVAGLRELGRSMVDHGQIQPVIVYPFQDPHNPAITHRLLNGQRRWSAALLTGLPTIWAVEAPVPTDTVRLLNQFEENERREGFSDMERAWALLALKEALQREAGGDVPWSAIEQQLQLSTARRQDLLRLLRFAPEGQALITRYGWSEWTLRPIHMAINAGELQPADATDMLRALADEEVVNATSVEAFVKGYRAHSNLEVKAYTEESVGDRPVQDLHNVSFDVQQRMARTRRSVEALRAHMAKVEDAAIRKQWQTDADRLRVSLEALLADLRY